MDRGSRTAGLTFGILVPELGANYYGATASKIILSLIILPSPSNAINSISIETESSLTAGFLIPVIKKLEVKLIS